MLIAAPEVYELKASNGAEEIRTPDLRRAKAALSQLSYGPLVGGFPPIKD
jgi:hypothetical protein